MRIAVVIPAFNEAATLRQVAQSALAQSDEVIVVDDGSTDASVAALAELPVVLLKNPSNQGKAASLWRGMRTALARGAEAVVTLDADGQHDPADIPRLVAEAQRHNHYIIIGARAVDRSVTPAIRYYANKFANFWISWACGYRLHDSQSGFRLYPARLLAALNIPHGRRHSFVFESELLIEAARLGYDSLPVRIPAVYQVSPRRSYYRHIDSLRITNMVGRKLLSRWLYPQGFYRAFLRSDESLRDTG